MATIEDRRFGAWMRFLGQKLDNLGNALLKDEDVTVMQLRVLRYLKTFPDRAKIVDIAEFFGVQHTSTIHVVNALEDKGFVRREPIPHSRGKKIVLTRSGHEVAQRNETAIDRSEEIMLEGFSEKEKDELFGFLTRIGDSLDKVSR